MSTIAKTYHLLLLVSVLLLNACTSNTASKENYSGFMPDYSKLEKVTLPDGTKVLRWDSPALGKKTYTKVFIDPVIVYPKPKDTAEVQAKLVNDAAAYLDQNIRQKLGEVIEVVDAPDADTLRLRAAITAVDTRAEELKAYEVIPIAAIAAGISSAAGTRDRNVEVFLEAELSDINTNEILARVVKKGISKETLANNKTKVEMAQLIPVLDGWSDDAVRFVKTSLKK